MQTIRFTIVGLASYSQSKKLPDEKDKKESYDEFEDRVWKKKAHVATDGDSVVIPGHALHQMLVVGAKKGRLAPKSAKSAREGLANRLVTGVQILGDAETDMQLAKAEKVPINSHANGKRGSGSRVIRKFPQWPIGWTATFDVMLLDESLTADDVKAALDWGGKVCGLGRFRPENMGHNGRFRITESQTFEMDQAAE